MKNGAGGGENKGKAKISKGKLGKEYVIHLVEALLKLAEENAEENKDDSTPQEVKVEWVIYNQLEVTGEIVDKKSESNKLEKGTTLTALLDLIKENNPELNQNDRNTKDL